MKAFLILGLSKFGAQDNYRNLIKQYCEYDEILNWNRLWDRLCSCTHC
jgi:hypothetical protein